MARREFTHLCKDCFGTETEPQEVTARIEVSGSPPEEAVDDEEEEFSSSSSEEERSRGTWTTMARSKPRSSGSDGIPVLPG